MNKLTLDEIGFIKTKIQQFIQLPTSPRKQTLFNHDEHFSPKLIKHKYKDSSSKLHRSKQSSKMLKKVQTKIPVKKSAKKGSSDNLNWFKQKQKQIEQFIIHENRNKMSVLNKFLNSDKIHLKKREQVEQKITKIYSKKSIEQNQQQSIIHSNSFSFDNEFSSLKKVYQNIQNFMVDQKQKENNNEKQKKPQYNNPIFNLLKNVDSKKSPLQNKQQQLTAINIQSNYSLVKPSLMKGKASYNSKPQVQTPKLFTIQNLSNIKKKEDIPVKASPNPNQLIHLNSEKQFEKSYSQIQIRNKNYSVSNQKKNKKNQKQQITKSAKNLKVISNSHSKNSLQINFDSEIISSIKVSQTQSKKTQDQKQIQNFKFYSPSKRNDFYSKNKCINPVYQKSNPYKVSNEQMYKINKYKIKDLSPDEKKQLKQRYSLLDKRLNRILESVKGQRAELASYQSDSNSFANEGFKVSVPDQILTYQKLSPLKKFLKLNKQLKNSKQKQY